MSSNNRGSTLIEILIATFIMAMSLVTLVSLTTMSISRNRASKEKAVATRLAQEGMDWMMAERNRLGFGKIVIDTTTYCLNSLGTIGSLVDGACGTNMDGAIYRRDLIVTEVTPNQITYQVDVTWGDTDPPQTVSLTGSLTRWAKQ